MTPRKVPFVDLKQQYQTIKSDILAAIDGVLDTTSYILGPAVTRFENAFAAYCNTSNCVAVGSGTDSLHVALVAAGIGPGDEVITQANTFIATVEAIAYTGAKPVFVDVKPPEYEIDIDAVAAAITPRTKAIIPVHLFGQPCNFTNLETLAKQHGLFLLVDASQSHGAEFSGERVGARGTASFSFYPGKNLGAYGEGGAVVTDDAELAKKMRRLRSHGSDVRYVHPEIGYNYRMDGIQGAILDVKLRHLDAWTEARRRIASLYDELLQSIPKPTVPREAKHVYHLYPVFVENRDELRAKLDAIGVETNVHYPIPCHLQDALSHLGHKRGDFPHSEYIADHELSIPMFPEMTEDDARYVAEALLKSLATAIA